MQLLIGGHAMQEQRNKMGISMPATIHLHMFDYEVMDPPYGLTAKCTSNY